MEKYLVNVCVTVGLAVLGWITLTLIEVDKKTAEIAVKVEANNAMITPIWENFVSEVKNGNIQKSDATTDQESTGQTEVVSGSEAEDQLQETSRFSERAHCASRKKRKR